MSGIGYNLSDAISRVHAKLDAEAAERERARAALLVRAETDPILRALAEHATLCGALLAVLRLRPGIGTDEVFALMARGATGGYGPEPEELDRALTLSLLDCMEQVGWVSAQIDKTKRLGQLAYFAR